MNYTNYKYKDNYKQTHDSYKKSGYSAQESDQHPEHPVRNVFFCIYCFFFSLAFSFLWIWELLEFEYDRIAVLIASVIIAAAVVGVVVSFVKSHHAYLAYRRIRKNRRYTNNFR